MWNGKKYSIVTENNPFGPRGGRSGNVVDATYEVDFHRSAAHADNMNIIIDNILAFMKSCNIQSMNFDYYKYHDGLKRKKVDKEIIEKIVFNEFIRFKESRFQLLIYMNKNGYSNALKN